MSSPAGPPARTVHEAWTAPEEEERIKVAVRLRTFTAAERANQDTRVCITALPDGRSIHIEDPSGGKGGKVFTYDAVIPPTTDQAEGQLDVYERCARGVVDSFVRGYNSTIMAYGQTGAGKTYTMGMGEYAGIIPRALRDVVGKAPPHSTFRISYLEIYNEVLRDLLNPGHNELALREGPDGTITVSNAQPIEAFDLHEMLALFNKGNALRTTAGTLMNSTSSRSHSIFTVYMQRPAPDNPLEAICSKFHLVDLAGSERNKKTGNVGERLKESIGINTGLLALGNVISALARRPTPNHIPFRDSKLTRLLQDSLGGSSRTVLIACISAAKADCDETMSTLTYAARAMRIANTPVVSRALLADLQKRHLAVFFGCTKSSTPPPSPPPRQDERVAMLEAQLREAREELEADEGIFAEYIREAKGLRKRVAQLEAQNAALQASLDAALRHQANSTPHRSSPSVSPGAAPRPGPTSPSPSSRLARQTDRQAAWTEFSQTTANAVTAAEEGYDGVLPHAPNPGCSFCARRPAVHSEIGVNTESCSTPTPTPPRDPDDQLVSISAAELASLKAREGTLDSLAKDNYYYQLTNRKLKAKLKELVDAHDERDELLVKAQKTSAALEAQLSQQTDKHKAEMETLQRQWNQSRDEDEALIKELQRRCELLEKRAAVPSPSPSPSPSASPMRAQNTAPPHPPDTGDDALDVPIAQLLINSPSRMQPVARDVSCLRKVSLEDIIRKQRLRQLQKQGIVPPP
eukprot:Sspe_Gene.58581::Locus_32143_Transcript_1_1_Confidence_1.000_Length_2529::g.58581::m.58581/K10395/KIF4_21_27; kinesin family member 4/21/27